jgi:hypothetical protein
MSVEIAGLSPRLETPKGFATVGVQLGPDGFQLAAYDHLLDTTKSWADKLWTSFLKEPEANAALKTRILKKLEYPLPVLLLTEAQCSAIRDRSRHANSVTPVRYSRRNPRSRTPSSHGEKRGPFGRRVSK